MKERLKWLGRVLLYGAIWVYLLSIPVKDMLLFDHAYNLLVQNSLVDLLARESNLGWKKLKDVARSSLEDKSDSQATTTL